VICTCPVCRLLHEMTGDHRNTEPCTPCYRDGWRDDSLGNVYRLPESDQPQGTQA
jgi:hypothetical protein